MFKQILPLALLAALSCGGVACKKSAKTTAQPGELTEAERVELRAKALENYKKLVEKYPDSPHAAEAAERIRELSAKKK